MSARPAVVVAVHDGYYGSGTGAGFANAGFLRTLIPELAPDVRLVVAPIRLTAASPEYQPDWHRRSVELCEAADALIVPADNGTHGLSRFGGVPNFEQAADSLAATLRADVLPAAHPVAVVAFDVPFLGVGPRMPRRLRRSFAVVPRSTGLLHDAANAERIAYEREGFGRLAEDGSRVAVISRYMRDHLLRDYQVPEPATIPLADGLTPDEWHPQPRDPSVLPPRAKAGFVFALGRATPYKGWDDLVDALALLRREGVALPHAVLAAVTDQPAVTDYQRRLAARIDELGLDATLLTRFDAGYRGLLAEPALRAVVVPSRAEPFGRVPLEAYAAGAAPVVATTAGGLAEQVVDGVTGFTAPPSSPARLAAALGRALALDDADRDRMRAAGGQLARERFDHGAAIRRFFAEFAPWALRGVR